MNIKSEGNLFSTKKTTIIYIVVAVIIVAAIVTIVLLNREKKSSESNQSKGYNEVYEISDYAIKINSAAYLEDTSELAFVYYIKKIHNAAPDATIPAVSKIEVEYKDEDKEITELTFSSSAENDIQSVYKASGYSPDGVNTVTIYIEYTDADYKDKDKVDEFGDVTEGVWHKGEKHTFYIIIDAKDIKKISSNDFKVPELNTEEMDKGTSVTTTTTAESSADDSSEAEKTITKKTTTTTKKTTTTTRGGDAGLPPEDTTTTRKTANSTRGGDAGLPPEDTTTTRRTANTTRGGDAGLPPEDTTTTRRTANSTRGGDAGLPPEDTTTTKKNSSNPIVKLALDKTVEQLAVGKSLKISPVYEPTNANCSFTWRSNREDRVTVKQDGTATAVGTGSAIITVTDNESGLTASCMITVK